MTPIVASKFSEMLAGGVTISQSEFGTSVLADAAIKGNEIAK